MDLEKDSANLYQALTKPLPVGSSVFLLVLSSAILFPTRRFEEALGMGYVLDHYRWVIGILFLIALSWLLVAGAVSSYRRLSEMQNSKKRYARLHRLTSDEKVLLREYLSRQVRSLTFSYSDNGTGQGLADDGVLYRPKEPMGADSWRRGVTFNILDWALVYLSRHPELIAKPEKGTQ